MFKVIDVTGKHHNVDAVEVDVWYNSETELIHITAYPTSFTEDGEFKTDSKTVLFEMPTGLDVEEWEDDFWIYAPSHSLPRPIRNLVVNKLSEFVGV